MARTTVAGERTSSARMPKLAPLDPMPALLRVDSDVLARLEALEAIVVGLSEAEPQDLRSLRDRKLQK